MLESSVSYLGRVLLPATHCGSASNPSRKESEAGYRALIQREWPLLTWIKPVAPDTATKEMMI
jgi:hypothetical protein